MQNNNREIALTRRGNSALMKQQETREEYVTPVADVFETPEAFVVKLDMPGARREALSVSAEPLLLTVKGPVESLHHEPAKFLRNEIVIRTYYRQFHLTSGLDHSRIRAEFEDGVLTVTIPKTDEIKLKEIPIQ